MRKAPFLLALIALIAAAAPASAGAITRNVRIDDTRYTPARLAIKVGDRIRYSWNARNFTEHDAVGTRRPRGGTRIRSPLKVTGRPYLSPQIRVAGTYTVICTIHGFSMRVTVTRRR